MKKEPYNEPFEKGKFLTSSIAWKIPFLPVCVRVAFITVNLRHLRAPNLNLTTICTGVRLMLVFASEIYTYHDEVRVPF